MDNQEYRIQRDKRWELYKAGELTLIQYYHQVTDILVQRLEEAYETGAPISGIAMSYQLLRSEVVREQFAPYLNDAFNHWMATEGVPAEVLNMKFSEEE
jgi:hypothetical protein